MAKANHITQEELKEKLHYNPSSGVFTWRKAGRGRRKNCLAGGTSVNGYTILYINKNFYTAHRLAWLYMYGEIPESSIDHINRVKSDNRITNLRLADHRLNAINTCTQANNTSGYKGVRWHTQLCKWHARIVSNKQEISLGVYLDWWDAVCARKSAENRYYGSLVDINPQ